MKVTCIPGKELDDPLKARWRRLRASSPTLGSPYFSVEYLLAASEACRDVHVGVIELDGQVQGFFPFQRQTKRIGGPVGGGLSDWHGIIGQGPSPWDMHAILRACGLAIWDFDHLPCTQALLHTEISGYGSSPVLDLGQGFDAYLAGRKAAGSQRIAQFQRKARKLEREKGNLRFESDSRNRRAFQQVLRWKREQSLRSRTPDFLSWGWTTELLERIWSVDTPDCAGRLSVLWRDDTIVAAHYGMRSASDWHWWFPTYNPEFSDYSPGGILLFRLAEAAAASGVRCLDLGKGEDTYKRSFATREVRLAEGSVLVPSLTSTWRRARCAAHDHVQRSAALGKAWALVKPLRDRLAGRAGPAPGPLLDVPTTVRSGE